MKRLALLLPLLAFAQPQTPITFSGEAPDRVQPGAEFLIKLTARQETGWHLYSLTTPRPPIATTLTIKDGDPVEAVAAYQPAPTRKLDPNFGSETETFEGEVVFYLKARVKPDAPAGKAEFTAQARFQACTDKLCLPPRRVPIPLTLTIDSAAPAAATTIPAGYSAKSDPKAAAPAPAATAAPQQSFLSFLLLAFGFGLAAIFTPCVFPMIPITMSYFIGQSQSTRAQQVTQAVIFCLGIIVLFTGMGFAITALLGASGVVQIGSNPWVNGFISAVFLLFGLSLLGAFEITLPSGLLTKLNAASSTGSTVGTLLMGLTFSLTSFACVGPFVGTLLAASVTGDKLQPVLGMAFFAAGLSLPFFLLALFPGFLARMPRAGVWMMRIKIVLGFVILAGMFKYLANVDVVLHWDVFTRERVLAAWVILLALPGLYILGFLNMEGFKRDDHVGWGRAVFGAAFLIFALSLVPGMWGARLGELDAYLPESKLAAAAASGEAAPAWIKNDLAAALAKAKAEGKPVFVAFTGYACTNCHWMKANLFPRPEIAAALKDFVLVELYTDGSDPASEANQKLQQDRFKTVAIPFYAVLSAEDAVKSTFAGLTRSSEDFLKFLAAGRA